VRNETAAGAARAGVEKKEQAASAYIHTRGLGRFGPWMPAWARYARAL
jgi:hypothetical protein